MLTDQPDNGNAPAQLIIHLSEAMFVYRGSHTSAPAVP